MRACLSACRCTGHTACTPDTCPATALPHAGSVKVSVLSRGPKDAGLLLKTLSKPINALSACPASPCSTSAPATPSSPAPATASTSNAALNMTGNPMVDMMSVFSMMYGAANAGQNPLGAVLNFPTAMTVISGVCACVCAKTAASSRHSFLWRTGAGCGLLRTA